MTKIKRTYKQLFEFAAIANAYGKKNEGKENKLTAAIKSIAKELKRVNEDYQEELSEIQLNNCSVDEKTQCILTDDKGNYQFTKDAQRKVIKEKKELDNKIVEVNQRIAVGAEDLITSLTDYERESFEGLVITEVKAAE